MDTTGHAYMVVSGLTKPGVGRHAVEMCCMSLDLIDVVSAFGHRRSRPQKPVTLRIGVHCGPCVAGMMG